MCVSMRRMPTGRSGDSLGPSALILHLVRDKMRAVDKISAESGADYTVDLPIILSFDHPDIDLPQVIRPAELIWQGDISKLRWCMQIFYFFWFKCFILYFTCHKCKAEPCVVPRPGRRLLVLSNSRLPCEEALYEYPCKQCSLAV